MSQNQIIGKRATATIVKFLMKCVVAFILIYLIYSQIQANSKPVGQMGAEAYAMNGIMRIILYVILFLSLYACNALLLPRNLLTMDKDTIIIHRRFRRKIRIDKQEIIRVDTAFSHLKFYFNFTNFFPKNDKPRISDKLIIITNKKKYKIPYLQDIRTVQAMLKEKVGIETPKPFVSTTIDTFKP